MRFYLYINILQVKLPSNICKNSKNVYILSIDKHKLLLIGLNLGQIFNFSIGCIHTMTLLCSIEKLSILELKNRPKATFRFPPIYSCASFLPFEKMLNTTRFGGKTRVSLLKGKDQYVWSPCTNLFRSAALKTDKILFSYKTMRKPNVLSLNLHWKFPGKNHLGSKTCKTLLHPICVVINSRMH